MKTRLFALLLGLGLIALGSFGFMPVLRTSPEDLPAILVDSRYGLLFGVLPVNAPQNVMRAAFGVWGLIAYVSAPAARFYALSVAIVFGALSILGLTGDFATLFGLAPLFGANVWLHAAIAILAGVFVVLGPRFNSPKTPWSEQ